LGVFIPNAFSPNNDGLNDIFFIVGYPIVKCEFWIYNRWGEEVFHSNQIENGWNGKFPNSDITLPQDVYSYTVDITAVDKERQILSGLIQLLH
jgi:gliding motility-associated-like protein